MTRANRDFQMSSNPRDGPGEASGMLDETIGGRRSKIEEDLSVRGGHMCGGGETLNLQLDGEATHLVRSHVSHNRGTCWLC